MAFIAFVAAGNPHIVQDYDQHSQTYRVVIEAPDGPFSGMTYIPAMAEDVMCSDNVQVKGEPTNVEMPDGTEYAVDPHLREVKNGTGVCYYMETRTTQSTHLVFYGFELPALVDYDGKTTERDTE